MKKQQLHFDYLSSTTARELNFSEDKLTGQGYAVFDVVIGRTGIQEYYGEDLGGPPEFIPGRKYSLYRPKTEVLDPVSVKTYEYCVLTDGHPDDLVDSKNSASYAKGWVHKVYADDEQETVNGTVVVTSQMLIDKIREGKATQISAGLLTKDDYSVKQIGGGDTTKVNVDGIITTIRANHVALVDRGNCGPQCSIKEQIKVDRKKVYGKHCRVYFGNC